MSDELAKIPHLISLPYTSGPYGLHARVYCRNSKPLREILHGSMQKIKGIERKKSINSLEERINLCIQLSKLKR